MKLNNKKNIKYIKITAFTFFIFFFDFGFNNIYFPEIKISYIDIRTLFLIMLPIFLYDFFYNFKKNQKNNIIILFVLLFLLLHFFLNSYYLNIILDKIILIKFLISLIYIAIFIHYLEFIFENFVNIIRLFLLVYFLILTSLFFIDLYNNEVLTCLFGCFSKKRILFKEASHLAYIAPIIIIFYCNYVDFKKLKFQELILLIFFFITVLYNLSTTLLANIILSLSLLVVFNYKKINIKKNLFILLIFIFLIPFEKNTLQKINHFYSTAPIVNFMEKTSKLIKNFNLRTLFIDKNQSLSDNNKVNGINPGNPGNPGNTGNTGNKSNVTIKNLSIEVMRVNFRLAIKSINYAYFGWGLHNYKLAHKHLINEVNNSNVQGVSWLNTTDGSNNFNKGIVEFGYLFLLIIILLFKFLVDNRIDINVKFLVFPLIFSQIFIRGSGFFNGGLIIFLLFLIIYKKNFSFKKYDK